MLSSFPHERKLNLSRDYCDILRIFLLNKLTDLAQPILQRLFVKSRSSPNIYTQQILKLKKIKTLNSLAVILWRGHFIVTCIEERCRVLYKIPGTDHLFINFCCRRIKVSFINGFVKSSILTWGSPVDNWAAALGSSHPGECTPAWLRFSL